MHASPSDANRDAISMLYSRLGDMLPPVERMIARSTRSKVLPDCHLYWPRVTKASKHERRADEN